MPAKRRPSISVLGVLTIDTWVGSETERTPQPVSDPNNRGHFMDVFQTESTGRTHTGWLSSEKMFEGLAWGTFCQCHKRWRHHQELLFKIQCWWEACFKYINRALKILIPEKTFEHEKMGNERGKRRNRHTRTSNGTAPLLRAVRSKS